MTHPMKCQKNASSVDFVWRLSDETFHGWHRRSGGVLGLLKITVFVQHENGKRKDRVVQELD